MKILSGRTVGRCSLTRIRIRPFLFLGILGFCVGWGYMASATLALSSDFEGLGFGGRIPPDTHGAVGPSNLMVTLNDRVGIQTRAGSMLTTIDLQSFWSPLGVSDVFDPRVVYDPHSGRFIVTTCAERRTAASSVLLAVSATSDPTGNWHMWQFDGDPTDKNWVDYPNVGFSGDKITITANLFNSASEMVGVDIWAIDKASALDGGDVVFTSFLVKEGGGTIVPCLTYDTGVDTQYLINRAIPNMVGLGWLTVFTVTGPAATASLSIGSTSPYSPGWAAAMPDAPQAGSTARIEVNDDRILNAAYRNGRLWCTQAVGLPKNAANHTAVKWWSINPDTQTTLQAGFIDDFEASGLWYYYPSIAVNANDQVLIGFSGSSRSSYVGCYYAGRESVTPAGEMGVPVRYRAGEGPYNLGRWGDYSATCVDPVDDVSFWTLQEYATTSSTRWGTWWAYLREETRPRVAHAEAVDETTIRVTFSEPMADNPSLVDPANYTVYGGRSQPIVLNVVRDGETRVNVRINAMTAIMTHSIVVATPGPTDLAGNPLQDGANTASFVGIGEAPASGALGWTLLATALGLMGAAAIAVLAARAASGR